MEEKVAEASVGQSKNIVEGFSTGMMGDIEKCILKKADLFDKSIGRYIMRAMLACFYLTLGTGIAVGMGNSIEHLTPGWGKFGYAFMFTWSLVMIIYLNAELGTSNMMYMTTAVHRKVLPWKKALSILGTCILFNAVGAIMISWALSYTGVFHDVAIDHYLITAVSGKLAKAPLQIFVEGIFANMVVNIAFFVTMRMKDDAGKVLAIVFLIFIFAFLGFEHVIANFSSFSLAFFASGGNVPGMTIAAVVTNIFFATLGNYVGGGLIMGLNYSWLNNGKTRYAD
ncbi:formate/nitrite transporter family protein [Desemzia sp. FAM 23989]|uniref:formate/nitrite transporter family protein n=1 Tax=Desemzia sp. FAM 23989 TaxID=3259523 RepID=UPI0038844B5D